MNETVTLEKEKPVTDLENIFADRENEAIESLRKTRSAIDFNQIEESRAKIDELIETWRDEYLPLFDEAKLVAKQQDKTGMEKFLSLMHLGLKRKKRKLTEQLEIIMTAYDEGVAEMYSTADMLEKGRADFYSEIGKLGDLLEEVEIKLDQMERHDGRYTVKLNRKGVEQEYTGSIEEAKALLQNDSLSRADRAYYDRVLFAVKNADREFKRSFASHVNTSTQLQSTLDISKSEYQMLGNQLESCENLADTMKACSRATRQIYDYVKMGIKAAEDQEKYQALHNTVRESMNRLLMSAADYAVWLEQEQQDRIVAEPFYKPETAQHVKNRADEMSDLLDEGYEKIIAKRRRVEPKTSEGSEE